MKAVFIAFLLFSFFTINGAQVMNEEFRKKPPEPLKEIPFSIGKPFETTLKNGLKLVVFENRRLPIVNFRLCFRSGEINDPPDLVGLTSAMVQMLNQGTKTRTSKQFAEEVESIGASIAASSNADNIIISGSSLNIYADKVIELMADMILNPIFPESELNLYKQNTIEALKFQRSQPSFLAEEQVARLIYGNHPYSIVGPKESDVEKLTRERILEVHKKTLAPNNAIFIVVGDVNANQIVEKIKESFRKWQKREIQEQKFDAPPSRTERTITIVDRKGSTQANIVISNLAIKRNHPDYFPVLVMNQILGAGASSRLFMNLRESKGYTYGAYSNFDMRYLAGSFEASAEVRTSVVGDAIKEFFYELNRIRNEKVSEQELQDAKNFLTGVFPIRLETQEGLTGFITQQQLFDFPTDYLQTYRDKVNAVTSEDVMRVAKQYILPDKVAIVIVGDAEEILGQVKAYASKVEILDTQGKPQNLEAYVVKDEKPTVDVSGRWQLTVEAQGQQLPINLSLEQNEVGLKGSFESLFGSGEITSGRVRGNKVIAIINVSFQGQKLEFRIEAEVKNDEMKGTITTEMMPTAIQFSGKKQK